MKRQALNRSDPPLKLKGCVNVRSVAHNRGIVSVGAKILIKEGQALIYCMSLLIMEATWTNVIRYDN